jgi:hypothetical protein
MKKIQLSVSLAGSFAHCNPGRPPPGRRRSACAACASPAASARRRSRTNGAHARPSSPPTSGSAPDREPGASTAAPRAGMSASNSAGRPWCRAAPPHHAHDASGTSGAPRAARRQAGVQKRCRAPTRSYSQPHRAHRALTAMSWSSPSSKPTGAGTPASFRALSTSASAFLSAACQPLP